MIYVLDMISPEWSSLFALYLRIINAGVVEYLQAQAGMRGKRRIYCTQVVGS